MLPNIPDPLAYDLSTTHGFLPSKLPLRRLSDVYYSAWEDVVSNLQPLLLSGRLREVVRVLPVLATTSLDGLPEWRRAYVVLGFLVHAYIWGGSVPEERIPPPLAIPFLQVCKNLELPPVATYAGLCLWNYRPIFPNEPIDELNNLSTLLTFTGSLDESWFYLISVAIEARGGPTIPLMLSAIQAARRSDFSTVIEALRTLAERLDALGTLLTRMYENCDSHVFYHRIRPFLAGSKNMADAGLPNGVLFEDGTGTEKYQQFGGGSNAQSSLIQFFDIVLGVAHRPTGERPLSSTRITSARSRASSSTSVSREESPPLTGTAPSPSHNFIQEMRSYMPGPHRRFLAHVASVANIREFVEANRSDRPLTIAYDTCLAMLRALRDKHIQMVTRYIIVKSRESRSQPRGHDTQLNTSPTTIAPLSTPINLATAINRGHGSKSGARGTGGSALIPFLKQARDETGEPAIDAWAKRLLSSGPAEARNTSARSRKASTLRKADEHASREVEIIGLAGSWSMDDSEGGLCHW